MQEIPSYGKESVRLSVFTFREEAMLKYIKKEKI
jgi:hypothetical protein